MDVVEETFKNLFGSKIPHDQFTVVWHAGEPLAAGIPFYEKAFELIERLRPDYCKISHSFQTNGSLIDQKWCDFIKKWAVSVGLSVDGPKQLHDLHRIDKIGEGSFNRAEQAMDLLRSNGIPFSSIAVVTKATLDNPHPFIDYFTTKSFSTTAFNIEETEGFNIKSSLECDKGSERFRDFIRAYYLQAKASGTRVREFRATEQTILHPIKRTSSQSIPMTLINVAMNGDYSTFSPELLTMESRNYGSFVFGNVIKDRFDDIWKNENFQHVYADIQAGIRVCHKTCDYFEFCGGGHPSNKFSENGSFNSAETMHCRLLKKDMLMVIAQAIQAERDAQSEVIHAK